MKKLCALLLVAVMCLGLLPFAVSADEPTWSHTLVDGVLTITGTGAVGTASSALTDYPWDADRATITEIVVGDGITEIGKCAFSGCSSVTKITYGNTVASLQMDSMAHCTALTEIVFGCPVTYVGQGSVFGSGAIAKVTIVDQSKSAFLSVATALPYNTGYESAEFTIVGEVVEDPEPERTWTWTLEGGVLTITGTGEVLADASGPYVNGFPWKSEAANVTEVVVGDGITKVGAQAFSRFDNLTKATFGKDVTTLGADVLSYNSALTEIVFNGPVTAIGQGVVYQSTNLASVTITGQTEEEFKAVATTKNYNDAFTSATYTVVGAVTPDPEPEPEPEPEPIVKQDIVIAPIFTNWENWKNSPNNPVAGAEPGVTQLLVKLTDTSDNYIDVEEGTTWKLTISANGESKTITLAPATRESSYKFYRFETCLGKGENQFVPVAGTDYTVQISIYKGEDLAYESAAVSGFTVPADLVPQVPAQPEWPDNWALAPLFGCVENWSGNTFFIVGNSGAKYESNKDIHAKLKDGTYLMKVIITDETDGKVYTIAQYMFDNEGTGKKEFYSDASFLRIAVCDYGIVPVVGHSYTVAYEITEGGELRYNATSEVGAFNAFNDAFKADGAIVPEEVPHTCEVSDKQEPTPEPTPDPEPTPTPVEPTPTPVEPSTSEEPTPTPTPTPEPTPEESKPATSKPAGGDDTKDDGGNTGLIVGIVIAVVAVAAIAVVVVFVVKKKKD